MTSRTAATTTAAEIIERACLSEIAEAFVDDYENCSGYIGDCVSELADGWTSIFTDDNIRFAQAHDEEVREAVADGLAMSPHEFFHQNETAGMNEYLQHVCACAEYIANERAIYDELGDIAQVLAARALAAKYGDELDAEAWENVELLLDAHGAGRVNEIGEAAIELYEEALS